ncbi:MAG TPA: hypothetical protein VI248_21290 [Kineosporiaceae bacterium]
MSVTFHNTAPAGRQLAWVSPDCALFPGIFLPPGAVASLSTNAGTTWAFLDPGTGKPVGEVVIDAGQHDAWIW